MLRIKRSNNLKAGQRLIASKVLIAIDMDGTASKHPEKVNELYNDKDNYIIIYTARKEGRRPETIKELQELGVNYHQLIMGKLRADIYIDDRNAGGLNWNIKL